MGQKIGRRPQTQLCGDALIAVTQFPDLPFSLLPIRPYTLICSEALYQSALGPPAYGYVEVLGDPAAVSYQTDLALSRISTGLTFSNFRLQRQSWRQQLLLQLVLALVLGLSCLMLVSILRYGLENAQAQRKAQTRSLLWRLGADRIKLRRAEALLDLRHAVSASLCAALALLAWEALEEAAALRSMAAYTSLPGPLPLVALQNLIRNTHWLCLAALLAAYWLAALMRNLLAARTG